MKAADRPGLTGATPNPDAAVIIGLRHFLASYADHRSAPPIADSCVGLADFLEKARPLLQRPPPVVPVPAAIALPTPRQLAATFASLHPPLRNSLESGDFLQVWSVAGLRRNELRNAAVLAWLLDPRGSHGHGTVILGGILSAAAEQIPSWPLHGTDLSRVRAHTEECPLGSDRDRVDIAIDGPDFVLFVEVKIDAVEGKHQLCRYAEAARDKAHAWRKEHALVIYLSPRPPAHLPPGVAWLTWRDIARVLAGVSPNGINGWLVHQFARHIGSFF
jgi:hypothetical protein